VSSQGSNLLVERRGGRREEGTGNVEGWRVDGAEGWSEGERGKERGWRRAERGEEDKAEHPPRTALYP